MKTRLLPAYFIFLSTCLLFSSCFHQDVKTSDADDIEKATIYYSTDTNYLISYETIFQARSKKSGQGSTRISGYNDTRISVYDVSTGKLLVRKELSKFVKGFFTSVLGVSNDQIWLYTTENGLQGLDLSTLEVITTQKEILSKNPSFTNHFSNPDSYSDIIKSYGFDEMAGAVLLTDNAGYKYTLNTQELTLKKIDDDVKFMTSFGDKCLDSRANLGNISLKLKGDARKTVICDKEPLNSDLSFLEGEFVLDRNNKRTFDILKKKYDVTKKRITEIEARMDSLELANGNNNHKLSRDAQRELSTVSRDFHLLKTNYEAMSKSLPFRLDEVLLQPDSSSFFIAHKSNTDKNALLKIAKLSLQPDNKLVLDWDIQVDGIFFNYQDAKETSDFNIVFSKGNPTFDFQYFELAGNHLIIMYLLHAICIDVVTGKLVWMKRM